MSVDHGDQKLMFDRSGSRLTLGSVVVTVTVAFFVSGCGGPSADVRFADNVCSATLRGVQALSRDLNDVKLTRAAPGPDTRATLVVLARDANLDAKSFGDELKAIPVPNPDDPNSVETWWLRHVAARASGMMRESERRVANLPKSPTLAQSIRAFQELESDILAVIFDITTAQSPLTTTLKPELKVAFDESKACKELDAATKG